jgi:hypothetical protein
MDVSERMRKTEMMATLIIGILVMQCASCFQVKAQQTTDYTSNEEMIYLTLYLTYIPDATLDPNGVGIFLDMNPDLYFKYPSPLNASLPAFDHCLSATYLIQTETPSSQKCVVTFSATYDRQVTEVKFNEAAELFRNYFGHNLDVISPFEMTGNSTGKTTYAITYGYLPYVAGSYLGKYTPENGFGALLDDYFNLYPGIMAFYTLKEGFFETWYIGVEQEILTEKDTYEGTKELKLTSLFNCSSIRAASQGQSKIVVAAKYSEEHSVEVKSTTPNYTSMYELTGENFTTKRTGEKRYIWNMTNSQELDDVTITLQLEATINNNQPGLPALTVLGLVTIVLIIIVAVIVHRRKRRRTPEQVNLRLQEHPDHTDNPGKFCRIRALNCNHVSSRVSERPVPVTKLFPQTRIIILRQGLFNSGHLLRAQIA